MRVVVVVAAHLVHARDVADASDRA
jgi:hypothetical protein